MATLEQLAFVLSFPACWPLRHDPCTLDSLGTYRPEECEDCRKLVTSSTRVDTRLTVVDGTSMLSDVNLAAVDASLTLAGRESVFIVSILM